MHPIRKHLTYSNAMATIAVFVVLGGTSYALATGSVDSREIKNNTIRSQDVHNHSLLAKDLRSGVRPFAWGQVRADASLRPVSSRVVTVTHPTTGLYCVILSGTPDQSELEGSSVTLAGTTAQALFPHVTNGQGADCSTETQPHLSIRFYDSGGVLRDARFSFVVP